MRMRDLEIVSVESEPFAENSYVIRRSGESAALVIDPGFDVDSILDILRSERLTPIAILNTHGHVDHIAGNARMKSVYALAPLIIGRNDAHLLRDPQANLSAMFGVPIVSPGADRLVDHGERLDLAGIAIEVREIPGHSPGSVVFVLDGSDPPIVFGGDVLFAGGVGRTDLGGDARQLTDGIRAHLYNLPDETVVWPGHGPATTIGVEKRTNPFVREKPAERL